MKHACPECSSNNLEEHFADYLNPISIGIICKDCGCRFVTNKNQKHCEIVMHGSKYDENEKIKELYACPNCNSSNTKQISKQEQKEVLTYKCYDCGYIFYPTDDQFMSRALEFIKHNYTSKQIPLLISDIIDLYPDNSININEIMKKLQAKKKSKGSDTMTRGDSYPAFDLPSILTGSFDMMNIEKTLSKPIQHDPDAKTLNISESTKPISLCCTKCKSENSEVLFEAASGFMKICRCKNCGRIFSDDAKCFDEEELISNIREHYTIEQLGNLFKKILEKY